MTTFGLMPGIVTLSIEFELGWGMHDTGRFSHLSHDRSAEETALSRLLSICDKNNLRISFDVVGHLYHKSCSGSHSGPYPKSWWKNDPGTSLKEHPHFYAPDMINSIINHSTEHEICTHTYSHILSERVSEDLLRHELNSVQSLHNRWELPAPRSIVMPRHQEVNYSVLSDLNIRTIRRPIRNYGKSEASGINKLWWLMTRDHPKCEILADKELIETTCTPHPSLSATALPSGQQEAPMYFRWLPQRIWERMHYQYLIDAFELAAETGCHIHLWTHLYNIANESQWRAIKPALKQLAELRERTDLQICRMCDLPEIIQ